MLATAKNCSLSGFDYPIIKGVMSKNKTKAFVRLNNVYLTQALWIDLFSRWSEELCFTAYISKTIYFPLRVQLKNRKRSLPKNVFKTVGFVVHIFFVLIIFSPWYILCTFPLRFKVTYLIAENRLKVRN